MRAAVYTADAHPIVVVADYRRRANRPTPQFGSRLWPRIAGRKGAPGRRPRASGAPDLGYDLLREALDLVFHIRWRHREYEMRDARLSVALDSREAFVRAANHDTFARFLRRAA